MTTEKKDLILKDLCARIPCGVKMLVHGESDPSSGKGLVCQPSGVVKVGGRTCLMAFGVAMPLELDEVKPYLRPMSSMTEDEKKEYNAYHSHPDNIGDSPWFYVDWLNAHHFDYRGLIEKGLALEAPEEMYEKMPPMRLLENLEKKK